MPSKAIRVATLFAVGFHCVINSSSTNVVEAVPIISAPTKYRATLSRFLHFYCDPNRPAGRRLLANDAEVSASSETTPFEFTYATSEVLATTDVSRNLQANGDCFLRTSVTPREYNLELVDASNPLGPPVQTTSNGKYCIRGSTRDVNGNYVDIHYWSATTTPQYQNNVIGVKFCNVNDNKVLWRALGNGVLDTTNFFLMNLAKTNFGLTFLEGPTDGYAIFRPNAAPEQISLTQTETPRFNTWYEMRVPSTRSVHCGANSGPNTQQCQLEFGDQQDFMIRFVNPNDLSSTQVMSTSQVFCIEGVSGFNNPPTGLYWRHDDPVTVFAEKAFCTNSNSPYLWGFATNQLDANAIRLSDLTGGKYVSVTDSLQGFLVFSRDISQMKRFTLQRVTIGGPTPTPPPSPGQTSPPTSGFSCALLGKGKCRDSSGGQGEHDTLCSGGSDCKRDWTQTRCESACKDRPNCVGYEWDTKNARCEVHYRKLTNIDSSNDRRCYTCERGDQGGNNNGDKTCKRVQGKGAGFCRASDGSDDDNIVLCSGNCDDKRWEVEENCAIECKRRLGCTAYEHDKNGRCEVHFGRIDRYESKNNRVCSVCSGNPIVVPGADDRVCSPLTNDSQQGFCRGSSKYERTCNDQSDDCSHSADSCRERCLERSDCKGYEIGKGNREGWCELHFESVTSVKKDSKFACYKCVPTNNFFRARPGDIEQSNLIAGGAAAAGAVAAVMVAVVVRRRRTFGAKNIDEEDIFEAEPANEKSTGDMSLTLNPLFGKEV